MKKTKELCSDIRHADLELAELTLRLENSLIRFTHQMNFLNKVQDVMEEDHKDIHEQTLSVYLTKLKIVTKKLQDLSRLQQNGNGVEVKRFKYPLKKDSLNKAIAELDTWQATSDQSWFLIMRMAGPRIDRALNNHESDSTSSTAVSIPSTITIRTGWEARRSFSDKISNSRALSLSSTALSGMQISNIPLSDSLMTAHRTHSNGQTSRYVLDRLQNLVSSRSQAFQKDARDLVRHMQHGEPQTFAMLEAKGFVLDSSSQSTTITLVFRHPPDTLTPRSLRDILVEAPDLSLSRRFKIAKNLAKAVSYVHTFGFVHKNIRPESILVFDTTNTTDCSAFLAGFGSFRRDEGWTLRRGDDALEKNLYRHPSRCGIMPEEDFCMQHDIYSLGVCLLEVGLWGSFIDYPPTGESPALASLLDIPATASSPQEISDFLLDQGKAHFVSLAQSRLPLLMGDHYAEIVETCLTCLDPDNADFGDVSQFQDEDGIRVGARYIEKVCLEIYLR